MKKFGVVAAILMAVLFAPRTVASTSPLSVPYSETITVEPLVKLTELMNGSYLSQDEDPWYAQLLDMPGHVKFNPYLWAGYLQIRLWGGDPNVTVSTKFWLNWVDFDLDYGPEPEENWRECFYLWPHFYDNFWDEIWISPGDYRDIYVPFTCLPNWGESFYREPRVTLSYDVQWGSGPRVRYRIQASFRVWDDTVTGW